MQNASSANRTLRFPRLAVAVVAAMAVGASSVPASAQSLFDFFFGAQRRPTSYSDSGWNLFGRPAERAPVPRVESRGSGVAYCVRTCDGRYFPIQRSAATPAQVCSSFCPAAQTKIFSGGSIDHAVAHDGSRYTDLDNAFAYRTKVVPGCTCNGKDAFGLVNMNVAEDPTLRPGDVVATGTGMVAFTGGKRRNAEFTPIQSYSGLTPEMRRQLSDTKIEAAADRQTPDLAPVSPARSVGDKRAQLER